MCVCVCVECPSPHYPASETFFIEKEDYYGAKVDAIVKDSAPLLDMMNTTHAALLPKLCAEYGGVKKVDTVLMYNIDRFGFSTSPPYARTTCSICIHAHAHTAVHTQLVRASRLTSPLHQTCLRLPAGTPGGRITGFLSRSRWKTPSRWRTR